MVNKYNFTYQCKSDCGMNLGLLKDGQVIAQFANPFEADLRKIVNLLNNPFIYVHDCLDFKYPHKIVKTDLEEVVYFFEPHELKFALQKRDVLNNQTPMEKMVGFIIKKLDQVTPTNTVEWVSM